MAIPTKKDYIKLKDLILSLRQLYQGNNKELDELKTNIYGLDSRIEDFYFYIVKHSHEINPELLIKFIEHRGALWRLRDNVSKFRGDFDYNRDTAKVWTDFNHHFNIIGHYPAKISDEKDFADKIDRLFNSEFYHKISAPEINVVSPYSEQALNIGIAGISFYSYDQNDERTILYYNGRQDTLVHDLNREMTPGKRVIRLLTSLDTPVRVSELPDYHQRALSFRESEVLTYQKLDNQLESIDTYKIENGEQERLILRRK